MYTEAGSRIKFQGFGHSAYGSREVSEIFHAIEKAFLLHLVYPTTNTAMPIVPDKRKSPRLQILDTGLMNYFAGLQKEIIGCYELDKIYQGKIIKHLVGQEFLASKFNVLNELHFWTREKRGSTAEVDYVLAYDGLIIPVEVKSGATGTLRSLQLFMEQAPHDVAVRLYGGRFSVNHIQTALGKTFRLINLPYYLTSQIESYLRFYTQ
jgi:predicted AAA+ superfamily ATPase